MGILDRLGNLRRLLSGARPPVEDERLLQLYWNRAELKKEFSRLQDERHALREKLKKQEGATQRTKEQLDQLEDHLGNPEVGPTALVYFQLRALWRLCAAALARFAQQLRRQQEERERRRQLMEFDQGRRRKLADVDRRLLDAQSAADTLEAQVKLLEARFGSLRGFWNYFRRRRLNEEIAALRSRWDLSLSTVTDLSDERAAIEAVPLPEFPGLSVEGRRLVNTAVIAYAQQLVTFLSSVGLACMAKETTVKRVYDVRYGSREECVKLMAQVKSALSALGAEGRQFGGLQEATERLRDHAVYRNDTDPIPLTDSIGNLPMPAGFSSGLEAAGRDGINVLIDDYWDVYKALLQ